MPRLKYLSLPDSFNAKKIISRLGLRAGLALKSEEVVVWFLYVNVWTGQPAGAQLIQDMWLECQSSLPGVLLSLGTGLIKLRSLCQGVLILKY